MLYIVVKILLNGVSFSKLYSVKLYLVTRQLQVMLAELAKLTPCMMMFELSVAVRRELSISRTRLTHARSFSSILSFETFKSSKAVEPPTKSLVCLHGILGSKKNWRTPCNMFTKSFPQFHAVAMDHRGHGLSGSTQPGQHTVESCANDVLRTLKHHDLPTVFRDAQPTILCGHSYSGKVVLSILDVLQREDSTLPEHVWILDSMPGHYDLQQDASHQNSVSGIIGTIMGLPAEFESKAWVEDNLKSKGIPKSVVDWLSTNIIPVDNSKAFRYSFDIKTVKPLFDDFCHLSMWDFLETYNGSANIHFIRAGKNSAWNQETLDRFADLSAKNNKIHLYTMPHVGHWLHAEDPKGVLDIIATHSGVKA